MDSEKIKIARIVSSFPNYPTNLGIETIEEFAEAYGIKMPDEPN